MIFTVSEDVKGSFVLSTLNKALSKGMSVSISGNKIYAPDIKMAIKQGLLIPVGDEYDIKKANISHEVVVQNRTDRVLVLEKVVLKPRQSLSVSRDISESISMISAEKNGFIHIISNDEVDKIALKKTIKKTTKKKTAKKKTTKKKVEEEVEEEAAFIPGAERQVTAKVWNFRDQESEDAKIVPKTPYMIDVTEEEHPDIDFIDEPLEEQEVNLKKTAKKKTIKKKTVKKTTKKKIAKNTIKKEENTTKKKKVKEIEPVEDRKIPKTQMDAIIELDSRGNPIKNASDALNHLIDSLTGSEEITFIDDKQAQERYEQRTDMD